MSASPATSSSKALGSRMQAGMWEERRRALRALLRCPLLVPHGADREGFVLVRRHSEWLRDWLARHTHWRLHADSEVARLRKYPSDPDDATRPAIDRRSGIPFSRRRYVMLCLALATLERTDRQTVLGQIAEGIVHLAAADPALADAGLMLDLNQQEQRRDLVHVVRLLIDYGVLVRIDGDEERFVTATGDVLYSIHRGALACVLNVGRGPSTIFADAFSDRLAELSNELLPDSDEARARALRTRLTTRLLDDPVLYYDDLTDAERAYLATQRPHILREVVNATGLEPEVRREGIALSDPHGDATDAHVPEDGTIGHLTLLLAEWLTSLAKALPERQQAVVGLAALRAHTVDLIRTYGDCWRKDVRLPGAETALVQQVIVRLEGLRLVQRVEGGLRVRPAIARYACDAVAGIQSSADGEDPSFWEASAS